MVAERLWRFRVRRYWLWCLVRPTSLDSSRWSGFGIWHLAWWRCSRSFKTDFEVVILLKFLYYSGGEIGPLALGDNTVPTWDGDPTTFETFSTASRWYERSLKENERKLAASRIWQKLTGAAKSVVRHLDPEDFDDSNGLTKLLNVLRESPLQKLPVPDSFSRAWEWSQLRRGPQETIPQLIVREEDLFVELQQALNELELNELLLRERLRRVPPEVKDHHPVSIGISTRLPVLRLMMARRSRSMWSRPHQLPRGSSKTNSEAIAYSRHQSWSMTERQHVLTLTKNATHFELIRRHYVPFSVRKTPQLTCLGAAQCLVGWW